MNEIKHLAIIMDGNQRWAKKNHINIDEAYDRGLDKLIEIIKYSSEQNIHYLTVYALSTENTKRKSINTIYDIIKKRYKKIISDISQNKLININIFGEKKNLSNKLNNILEKSNIINNKSQLTVNIAFNYGSDSEFIEIIKKIIDNKIQKKDINLNLINQFRYLKDIPNPDLLIRTGGYNRLSNFLLIYLQYTELFFINTLWPDFQISELESIFLKFKNIKRTYGL